MEREVEINKSNTNEKPNKLWWTPFFDYQDRIFDMWKNISPQWAIAATESYEKKLIDLLHMDAQNMFSALYNQGNMFKPWLTGGKTEPYIDIVSDENAYKIYADVPGIDVDSLAIDCFEDALIIKGVRNECSRGAKYLRRECSHGPFSRAVALPLDADLDHAVAKLTDNILRITVPKQEAVKKGLMQLKADSKSLKAA